MNITFITNTFSYGGAEKMLCFLAEGLKERGHEVSVVNLNTIKMKVRVPGKNIKYRILESDYKGTIKTNWEWIQFTKQCAKEFHSEVLVGFHTVGSFCAVVTGKILGIPSVVCERNNPFLYAKAPLSMRVKISLFNFADGAVFQTEGAASFFSHRLQKRCKIINNPIFLEGEVPPFNHNNRPHTIVTLGRLENPQKRVDVMLHCFAKFHISHPDYKLVIYGIGKHQILMETLAAELSISDFVIFKGLTRQSMIDLSKEGIFLITSDWEGISNSLLEAMAVGMPVVSTDHVPGGARLLIEDHKNGLLAPVHDIAALANALGEFADNPELAEQCGKEAKKVLDRFSPDKILNEWENYILSFNSLH